VKALLVRLSSIGDVVHTLPVLAALRQHGWDAGWLVEPASQSLLVGQEELSLVVRAPAARAFRLGEARRALGALRSAKFDVALDLQGLWKSAAWARLAGALRSVGFARKDRREGASALLLRQTIAVPPEVVHVIDKNLSLLRAIGIDAVGLRQFPLPRPEEARHRVERVLGAMGLERFVMLNPGGGWKSKLWPAEAYGALATALAKRGLASLVSHGPGEEALADRVVAGSSGAARRCFPTTLLEYVDVARRAALVVGADTGPLHLACAVGTPVVALFGPTDPARNGPFDPADQVVRAVPPCAPCHKRNCAVHQGIMDSIRPEAVVAAIEARLGAAGKDHHAS
jgi:heptosyltransferase-1